LIYWRDTDDGEKVLVGQYGRQIAHVRDEVGLALKIGQHPPACADLVETRLTRVRE
jgi:hypothetical protein